MANSICLKTVIRYFAAFFLFCTLYGLAHGQHVSFEILNSQFDYAIFVGETDIGLQCCVTNSNQAMIRIGTPAGILLMNNGQSNCLNHTIPVVMAADMGVYKCTLTYTCAGNRRMVRELSLFINIPNNNGIPQCVRNGTYGTPYEPDELLLMSCFCRQQDNCSWIATVPGTQTAVVPNNRNVLNRSGTNVVQILVAGEALLGSYRFDCFYITASEQTRICSIGPRNKSSNDNVVSNAVMEPNGCPVTSATTISSSQNTNPTRNRPDMTIPQKTTTDDLTGSPKPTNDDQTEPFEGLTIVIIAVSVFVCFLIVVVIIVVIIWRRKGKNDSVDDTDDNAAYKNYAFSTGDDDNTSPYYNTRPGTASHASKGAMNSASTGVSEHTYDSTPMRKFDSVPDDGDVETPSVGPAAGEYAEVGALRSPSSEQEVGSGDSQKEEGHVEGYSPVYREPEPITTTDDHEGDFGLLYATVNKKKKKGVP